MHHLKGMSPSAKNTVLDLLILSSISLVFFKPLYNPQFFWSHDEAQLLWRITEFHANADSGSILCRWFPDLARGLGLPFLEFFPVLFLYIAEIFKQLTFGTIASAKMSIVLVSLFGSFSAYLLGKELWSRFGGLISGVLFTFIPYRIFDLYVRGDVNEFTALAILPFNLWIFYRTARLKCQNWVSLTAVFSIAASALAHYPSAVLQFPVYAVWIVLLSFGASHPKRFLICSNASVILGLLLSAYWWGSAFFSRHLVQMEGMTKGFADYRDQFIYPLQWVSLYWNYGASVKGPGDTLSFQIGTIALLFTLFGLPAILNNVRSNPLKRCGIFALFLFLLLATFLTHESSKKLWQLIPILPLIQFPYRLLQIPALAISILGGSLGLIIERKLPKYKLIALLFLLLIIIGSSWYMCRSGAYLDVQESALTPGTVSKVKHTHCTGEFIPHHAGNRFPPPEPFNFKIEKIPDQGFTRLQMEEKLLDWLRKAPHVVFWTGKFIKMGSSEIKPGIVEFVNDGTPVLKVAGTPVRRIIELSTDQPVQLRYNQFYFEGWKAALDGKPHEVGPDPDTALIVISVPSGSHVIELTYENLPLASALGTFSIVLFFLLLIVKFISTVYPRS